MSLAPSSYPHLWRTLVSQELAARYRGSLLGRAWPILLPLLMLAIYGFVFGVVFRSRWPGLAEDDHLGFTLNLFAGLLVHGMLAETVGQAPGLLLRHSNFVRKVVFPLPVLVAVPLGVTLIHTSVGLGILVLANALCGSGLHLAALAGIVDLNPISWPVEALRGALLHGQWPAPAGLLAYSAAAVTVLLLGALCFRALRRGFADVL